jgi:tRNA G46 methylase TrmB
MLYLISVLSFLATLRSRNPSVLSSLSNSEIYNIDVVDMHPKTAETALKHCETYKVYAEKSVCAAHTLAAFKEASQFVDSFYKNGSGNETSDRFKYVIIDSGCGAGMSTVCLASLYPNIPVIGIDRSIARLSRNKKIEIKSNADFKGSTKVDMCGSLEARVDPEDDNQQNSALDSTASSRSSSYNRPLLTAAAVVRGMVDEEEEEDDGEDQETSIVLKKNAILLRAELSDFFSLVAYESDWIVHSHYLLYPNPYPKAKHLKRRWHGHPIFPVMLALGWFRYLLLSAVSVIPHPVTRYHVSSYVNLL